jgi:hypothetical protein
VGQVRQPTTLVHAGGRPLTNVGRAPRIGEHTDAVVNRAPAGSERPSVERTTQVSLPLQGVTILELGAMFAGPYGATLLTDLGARVIKIEPLEGDYIRALVAFPEAGGAKVLQGKESVAVDFATPEGRAIVHELVKKVDVVLQRFRAGVAERAGIDEKTLKDINPDLVYLNALCCWASMPRAGACT